MIALAAAALVAQNRALKRCRYRKSSCAKNVPRAAYKVSAVVILLVQYFGCTVLIVIIYFAGKIRAAKQIYYG